LNHSDRNIPPLEAGDEPGEPRAKPSRPPWLRVRMPHGKTYEDIKRLMRLKSLHTVCEEAVCPNMAECWGSGTATFLILGKTCTRDCRFCAVRTGHPGPDSTDVREPDEVAEAVAAMGLRHVVITSVTRDDLDDGGAALFAQTIRKIRARIPACTVEVLIPDFRGDPDALRKVVDACPDILGHNIETVERLYGLVRPQADYGRSLDLLRNVKTLSATTQTKSGLMAGLGETHDELLGAMADLRGAGCDILTLGQYLSPSSRHLPVVRYYTPEEFEELKESGKAMGFAWVEAGPLVRSSYHAEEQARTLCR
jgi:lipoyl synthase